jgi:hypothetical protein
MRFLWWLYLKISKQHFVYIIKVDHEYYIKSVNSKSICYLSKNITHSKDFKQYDSAKRITHRLRYQFHTIQIIKKPSNYRRKIKG